MALARKLQIKLKQTTFDPVAYALASRANRPVDTLDKVYTRLVLGKRHKIRGDKLRKKG